MQRILPTLASTLTLSQALGAIPQAGCDGSTTAQAAAPQVSGPMLAQERQAVLEEARLEGLRRGETDAASALQNRLREQGATLDAAHQARMKELAEQQLQLGELLRLLPEVLDRIEARVLEDAAVLAFAAVTRMYGTGAAAGTNFQQLCALLLDEHRERPVLLRVAPSMHAVVDALSDAQVRVESASTLSPGQAQLLTAKGIIDGGVEVRLDAIRAAFLTGLAGQPS